MSWNEVKISLAPTGSRVEVRNHESAVTGIGEPVKIVNIVPPLRRSEAHASAELERWFKTRNFRQIRSDARFEEYIRKEVSGLVEKDPKGVIRVRFNFVLDSTAREKMPGWKSLIEELCCEFSFRIVDPGVGMVEPGKFDSLVTGSFAWQCLLKLERSS
jgi:hypothetical protein